MPVLFPLAALFRAPEKSLQILLRRQEFAARAEAKAEYGFVYSHGHEPK
jgi:hypothetical protein